MVTTRSTWAASGDTSPHVTDRCLPPPRYCLMVLLVFVVVVAAAPTPRPRPSTPRTAARRSGAQRTSIAASKARPTARVTVKVTAKDATSPPRLRDRRPARGRQAPALGAAARRAAVRWRAGEAGNRQGKRPGGRAITIQTWTIWALELRSSTLCRLVCHSQ